MLEEERKRLEEVLVSARRELEEAITSAHILEPVREIEVIEVGIQAAPEVVDAATEPQEEEEEEVEVVEGKRKGQGQ